MTRDDAYELLERSTEICAVLSENSKKKKKTLAQTDKDQFCDACFSFIQQEVF